MLTKQVIRAASGWLELGMPDDALEELKGLSPEERSGRKALELKLAAEMAKMAWQEGSETALELCEQAADVPDFFLSAAYCLHEIGMTHEARCCLLRGPSALHEFAVFHYNMACYLWTLDEKEDAKTYLERAVEMDESFLETARTDRDLVGMKL